MARMPDLEVFAAKHGLKILTIADLITHLQANGSHSDGYAHDGLAHRNGVSMHTPLMQHQLR
jgi:hypothetical protein